jgi:signal transduction histidine kinase
VEAARAATASLTAAHQRFAKAVLWLYLGAAVVAIAVLLLGLFTDRHYDEERREQRLLLDTHTRARYLGQHLRLLAEELQRLGTRSEVDLLDQNLAPEQSLLDLAHANSTFFDLGVAILDSSGAVVWAEPSTFLGRANLGGQAWFGEARRHGTVSIVPVDPDAQDAIVYVVSPIHRAGRFTGALLGGIDLARGRSLEEERGPAIGDTVLATREGSVVFPPEQPRFATSEAWRSLFAAAGPGSGLQRRVIAGHDSVVGMAPVGLGGLVLLTVARADILFEPVARRVRTRLFIGMSLAVAPLLGLVLLFRRSLESFRRSEEAAVRADQLQRLGEASNLIAHEVKNSLNGLRMGLDLVLSGRAKAHDRVVTELQAEIERLSSFAHQLMLFARDPVPKRTRADLSDVVTTALSLTRDLAAELGVQVEVHGTEVPVPAQVDPTLVRIIISNLISNALDALATVSSTSEAPRVVLTLETDSGVARLQVSDNGPGVPAELAASLFEPFVTGKPSGVGIGLVLSRKLARAHGGELELETTRKGARFLLTLPLEPA